MANGDSNLKPESDVYTVLIVVGTLFLIAATVFTAMRTQQLFGNWIPF